VTLLYVNPLYVNPWQNAGVNTIISATSTKGPSDAHHYRQSFPTWLKPDGTPISCVEKIKVLNENFIETTPDCSGCAGRRCINGFVSETQIRAALHELMDELIKSLPRRTLLSSRAPSNPSLARKSP